MTAVVVDTTGILGRLKGRAISDEELDSVEDVVHHILHSVIDGIREDANPNYTTTSRDPVPMTFNNGSSEIVTGLEYMLLYDIIREALENKHYDLIIYSDMDFLEEMDVSYINDCVIIYNKYTQGRNYV